MNSKTFLSAGHLFITSVVAVLLIAATFTIDAIASRKHYLTRGSQQLQYANRMLATNTARSFDGINILLDELSPQLAQSDNGESWSPQKGHEFLKKHLAHALPQIRHLLIFSADGNQRFTSFDTSSSMININDRSFFQQLRNGAPSAYFGPYIGRNAQQPGYAVARRLDSPDKGFAGALVVAIEPKHFEESCCSTRPSEAFESALINAEGLIIAMCRPPAERAQLSFFGKDFRMAMAGGSFAGNIGAAHAGNAENSNFILSAEAVAGYPDLRIVSSAPKSVLLTLWYSHLQRSLLLSGAALLALGIAAWLIRRQIQQINNINSQLREYHEQLESRIYEATRELDRRRHETEYLAQAKSRFLSAASHDLRQPMQALRLFVGELQRDPDSTQRQALLQHIEQSTEAMSKQLESMIVLSRLDMANIEPQPENISVNMVFRRIASAYQSKAEENKVQLVFLPREAIIHSDAILLEILLGKLVDNAINFSRQGAGMVVVCARWGASGTTRIDVRDNGEGIAEEYQQRIFEEFFQLDNTARGSDTGLGLGLSIASRITGLLRIPLTLHSRPGTGSTFTLKLAAASTCLQTEASATLAMPRLIMIGSDNESSQMLATQALEWGYPVQIVAEVETARTLLLGGDFIAIVLINDCCDIGDDLRALLYDFPGIAIHPAGCDISGLGPYHMSEPIKPARLRALLRSLH